MSRLSQKVCRLLSSAVLMPVTNFNTKEYYIADEYNLPWACQVSYERYNMHCYGEVMAVTLAKVAYTSMFFLKWTDCFVF